MSSDLRIALLLAMAIAFIGCGKKGPPKPPLRWIPETTTDLKVAQQGGELLLELAYPALTVSGMAIPGVEAIEIWNMLLAPPSPQPDVATVAEEPTTDDLPVDAEAVERSAVDAPESPSDEPPEAAANAPTPAIDEVAADEVPIEAEVTVESDAGAEVEEPEGATRTATGGMPPVDPGVFSGGATLLQTVAGEPLAAATLGNRIALRLPLTVFDEEQQSLIALATRTISVDGKRSALSNIVTILPQALVPPPTDLLLEPRLDGIELGWAYDSGNVEGFLIYRRSAETTSWGSEIATVSPTSRSFLDDTAAIGNRYVYTLRAIGSTTPLVESSIASEQQIEYRDVFAPAAPENLVGLHEDNRVRLFWAGGDEPDLRGYHVYRRNGDSEPRRLNESPLPRPEFFDSEVDDDTAYTYEVTAVDLEGNESDPSEPASVAP